MEEAERFIDLDKELDENQNFEEELEHQWERQDIERFEN